MTPTRVKRSTARRIVNAAMNRGIMDFFPAGFTPRPNQTEALERIEAAFAKPDIDYVVLEAPTGTGKTHISVTVASYFGSAYLATLTEQLQTQYTDLFGQLGMKALKGRGKFQCSKSGTNCKVGAILNKGRCGEACPYTQAKIAAFKSKLTVGNYHSLLANIGQAGQFVEEDELGDEEASPIRPLMVLDECHTVENFLLSTVGFHVDVNKLHVKAPDLPNELNDSAPYVEWMKEVIPLVKKRAKDIVDPEEKEDLRILIGKMAFAVKEAGENPSEFIPERGEGRDGALRKDWFAWKPLRVAKYGHWVYGFGEKLLLMSATVLDAGQLVKNIGLDPAKGEFIQMGSVFPKENRPIVVFPMDMRKNMREENWPTAAELVNRLLNHHRSEKGLLLCPSNEMLKFIRGRLERKNSERLIFAYGDERRQRYEEHVRGRAPTVLAASGYWEGADLKDDAARFSIIPSCPRPMWQGQIKARSQLDPNWYRWLTFTKLIQGYGRIVRSENDEGIMYLFDRDFVTEMNAKHSMIPAWVREAVTVKTGAQTYEG